jgi:hypothetical protein
MRFYFTIFSSLFLLSSAKGQFVFTAVNTNPVIGDNYIEYSADTTGVNPGSAGANQIWDFHFLNINTSSYASHSFVAPLVACYPPPYSTATIEDSVTHEYYLTNNTFMSFLGDGESGIIYTNDTIFFYPFSYGSNYQNNCSVSDHCGGLLAGSENSNTTYDGYGTLVLPGITYNNVSRILEFTQYHFTYGQYQYSDGYTYTYKWYENNMKFPVLTISIPEVSLKGYLRGKTVFVQNYTGVGINNLNASNDFFYLYPNPANGTFILNSNIANGEICIYNTLGENIYSQKNQNKSSEIDLSKQPNGIYFLQMKTGQRTATKKIVINK